MVDMQCPRRTGVEGQAVGLESLAIPVLPGAMPSDIAADTPRQPVEAYDPIWNIPPVSPGQHRRTKSRASHLAHRTNSLTESKVSGPLGRAQPVIGMHGA